MKSKILLVLSILSGLVFILAGSNKLFQYMPPPEEIPEGLLAIMEAVMTFEWLLPLIGIVEMAGGILLLFPKTRALGALVLFPVLVGILLTHIFNAPQGLPMAIGLFAVNAWIMIHDSQKFKGLLD